MMFRNKYWFLNNLYPCSIAIDIDGSIYNFRCAESAYQAFKNLGNASVFTNVDGLEAERLGKQIETDEQWELNKEQYMEIVVSAKFIQNEDLMEQLLKIDGDIINEYRYGDTYWGVVREFDHTHNQTGEPVYKFMGENKLGKILMKIRDNELKRRGTESNGKIK